MLLDGGWIVIAEDAGAERAQMRPDRAIDEVNGRARIRRNRALRCGMLGTTDAAGLAL